MTEYYAEKEEDPYRRNDIGIEHHTMSESSTEDNYEDSLSYKTASTKIERVPGIRKIIQAGNLRTGKIPLQRKKECGSQLEEKEDPTKEVLGNYEVRQAEVRGLRETSRETTKAVKGNPGKIQRPEGKKHGEEMRPRGIRRSSTGQREKEGTGGPDNRNPRKLRQARRR